MIFRSDDSSYDYATHITHPTRHIRMVRRNYLPKTFLFQSNVLLLTALNTFPAVNVLCLKPLIQDVMTFCADSAFVKVP